MKISNLFLQGSIGLEGRMNDERMIFQTPTVHKLDEVSSWCLADCSKYVRRLSEEESVKKSECGLSCWLVLPAARKQRETGQVCPARKACVQEDKRMLPRLFIVARGSDPGRMAWNILIGQKYEFRTKTVKIFLCQTIIWNSFCYKMLFYRVLLPGFVENTMSHPYVVPI